VEEKGSLDSESPFIRILFISLCLLLLLSFIPFAVVANYVIRASFFHELSEDAEKQISSGESEKGYLKDV